MLKNTRRLSLNPTTIRRLSSADMRAVAGGLPTANVSAENVSCCSFDAACPSEGCTILSRNTRCADCF